MTSPSLLQRVVRARVPDLMLTAEGFWRGSCPACGRVLESSPTLEVRAAKFGCTRCGVHGDAITFLMADDQIGFGEAVEELARLEARAC